MSALYCALHGRRAAFPHLFPLKSLNYPTITQLKHLFKVDFTELAVQIVAFAFFKTSPAKAAALFTALFSFLSTGGAVVDTEER